MVVTDKFQIKKWPSQSPNVKFYMSYTTFMFFVLFCFVFLFLFLFFSYPIFISNMLICGLKQSLAPTRKIISKSHHYAIRNVRRAIRTEMANKRRSVNWYQPDFHMSEKSQTKRSFYYFPIKKDIIRQFSAESFQFAVGERKRVEQLVNWYLVTIFE